MNTCPFCDEGRYASPLTNWDSVPCDRCGGSGEAGPLVQIGEAVSRRMLAELDAYVDAQGTLPVVAGAR